jgi:hypothetical protein
MKPLKPALASLMLLAAMSAPALAQGNFQDGATIFVAPNNQIMQKAAADRAFLMMATKDVTPVAAGTLLVMYDGKLYLVTDKKLPDGHMMSEMAFGPR